MLRDMLGLPGRRRYERAARAARQNLDAAIASSRPASNGVQRRLVDDDRAAARTVAPDPIIDVAALERQRLWCATQAPPPSSR